MKNKSLPYICIPFIVLGLAGASFSFIYAEPNKGYLVGAKPDKQKDEPKAVAEEKLTEKQKIARGYRAEGVEMQRVGNLDGAMSMYQKTLEMDPSYAIAYNDLGVIYELKGMPQRAEDAYLDAIEVDPKLLSPYSNLALLYENNRKLDKALYYWRKRAEFGSPDDPWTQKAALRSKDIKEVIGDFSYDPNEEQVISLLQEVDAKKEREKKDNKAMAKGLYEKAQASFNRGNKTTALKQAIDAMQLDPDNQDIKEFVDRVQLRLLSD